MGAIKVSELYKHLGKLMKDGFADKEIWISADDEGNGFHGLYYLTTTKQEDIDEFDRMGLLGYGADPKKIILLG